MDNRNLFGRYELNVLAFKQLQVLLNLLGFALAMVAVRKNKISTNGVSKFRVLVAVPSNETNLRWGSSLIVCGGLLLFFFCTAKKVRVTTIISEKNFMLEFLMLSLGLIRTLRLKIIPI
ncbi:MAG: hypothetical protein HWD62_12145 [Cyclobacteriaceae bacterium]|nr:MAG: hypothetical protein HWD62_12145 [Cyclobacteriaceae bacterium]